MKKAYLLAAMLQMTAQAAQSWAAEPAQKARPDKPTLICRTERSGSLTRTQRICLTQQGWDRLAADAARYMGNAARANDPLQAAMPGARPR